jgi:hypothetical protein
MTVRGLTLIQRAIGKRLLNVTRHVLGLGWSSDEEGHGITVLRFEDIELVVRPGPNEDFIEVLAGPLEKEALDPIRWSEIDLTRRERWKRLVGHRLEFVDCYSDGVEDVALVFHLTDRQHFSIVLWDTDLLFAAELEPFSVDVDARPPEFRARVSE